MMDAPLVNDTSETETKTIIIDGRGDVVFELSSPELADVKTHLLVSSKVLSLVSPVLEKVCAWETQAHQSKHSSASESLAILVSENRPASKSRTPPVIALPEDDTETFTLLCKIAHHQMYGIPRALEPDSIAKFASMCHKYDCIGAVSHSSFRWLQAIVIESHNTEELNKLLFAAFVLDMPEAFEKISARILLLHKGPFLQLPGFTDHDLAPPALLAEFAAKHAILAMELKDALHRTVGTGGDCISANRWIADCIRYLQPLSHISYANMIQPNYCLHEFLILEVFEPSREYCLNGKGCSACNKYRNFSFNEEFGKEKKKVINEFNGLCLDCVSTGRESFRTNQCRIKHAVQTTRDRGQIYSQKSIKYGQGRQGGKGPSSGWAVK